MSDPWKQTEGFVVTAKMKAMWEATHSVFKIQGEVSWGALDCAEDVWYEYLKEFEKENSFDCPGCGAKMAGSWCVWGCCCPIAPYHHYCQACGRSWYRRDQGTWEEEVFEMPDSA